MKELKEILDYLDYGVNSLSISKPPFKIEYEDIKKLLDYITNLQQENERLKENNMSMQEEMVRTWEKADLYKEAIEEVREYVEELYDNTDDTTCYDIDRHRKEFLLQILDKAKN